MRQAKVSTIPLSVSRAMVSLSCLLLPLAFLILACPYMSPYSHNPIVPLSNILLWLWKEGRGGHFKRRSVSLTIMCRAASEAPKGLMHRCKSI